MNIGAIGKKLGQLVIVILIVSFGTFVLASLIPGDPAVSVLGEGRTPAEYEEVRQQLGLNDPLLVRYWDWLTSALQGDLGNSLVPPQQDVLTAISSALPVSVQLAVMGLVIALVVAVPLALWSAHHEGGVIDRVISAATFGVLSVPSFLAGLLLIMVTVNWLGWFPRSQWVRIGDSLSGNLSHAILPAITISLLEMAMFTRVLRSDLVTTLREDYILASKSKGIPTLRVLFSDALRPSSFSLIPMMGLGLDGIIGSAQSRWLHFGVVSVAPIVSPSCTPVPSWKRRRPKSCSLVLTTRTP